MGRRYVDGMKANPAGANKKTQSSAALDYARIEKAIHYLESHFLDQPGLAKWRVPFT